MDKIVLKNVIAKMTMVVEKMMAYVCANLAGWVLDVMKVTNIVHKYILFKFLINLYNAYCYFSMS